MTHLCYSCIKQRFILSQKTILLELLSSPHFFHQAGVDCGDGDCHYAGDGYDHPFFFRSLDSHEGTYLAFELASRNADHVALCKVYIRGLEKDELVVVTSYSRYETLHLILGNDYLLAAAAVNHILKVVQPLFYRLYYTLAAVDEQQIAYDRGIFPDFSVMDYLLFPLHRDKALQTCLLETPFGFRPAPVGGSHRIPEIFFCRHIPSLFRQRIPLGL